jgi:hypothetical protein
VSQAIEDHFAAFFALLEADATLNPYDGVVPTAPAGRYSVVYFYIETPSGLLAPDAISLAGASTVIDGRAYVHNVGLTQSSARIQSGRSRTAVLDVTPVIAGRSCSPIRWLEGQPPQRSEDIPGTTVFDLVDVYGWRSVPS